MKYVIIGNGPAAVTAAETIRRADDAGEITLLSKEDEFTYSRPLISYLLCGKTDETRMRYKPADFYARNRVDFHAGVAAVAIDKDEKTGTGSDGNVYPYDKLLLATGAEKFDAVHKLLAGKVDLSCPATVLLRHENVTILCDRAAFEGV